MGARDLDEILRLSYFLIRELIRRVWMLSQLPLRPVSAPNFVNFEDWKAVNEAIPEGASDTRGSVPKTLFISWRSNQFGRAHRSSLISLARRNPQWEFVFLDDLQLTNFMADHCDDPVLSSFFHRARYGQIKTDLARISCVTLSEVCGWMSQKALRVI